MANADSHLNGTGLEKPRAQRIWLLEDRGSSANSVLEGHLRKLADLQGNGFQFAGVCSPRSGSVSAVRARQPDILVLSAAGWPAQCDPMDWADLYASFLIASCPENLHRFLSLGTQGPIACVPAAPTLDSLYLGLRGLTAAKTRDASCQAQIAALQARLNDRIVIERAKGILIKKLNISEEEAYKRLRLSSRRQRRQIRDIAQSLLDTQSLLCPEENGQGLHSETTNMPTPKIEKAIDPAPSFE